jgi:hypothetical protein
LIVARAALMPWCCSAAAPSLGRRRLPFVSSFFAPAIGTLRIEELPDPQDDVDLCASCRGVVRRRSCSARAKGTRSPSSAGFMAVVGDLADRRSCRVLSSSASVIGSDYSQSTPAGRRLEPPVDLLKQTDCARQTPSTEIWVMQP